MPEEAALCALESGAQMGGGGAPPPPPDPPPPPPHVDVVLFSHFHIDHSGDFPALVFSSWFEDRKRPLPVYGPSGNAFMPSTMEFVRDLFNEPHGAWRYLSELAEPGTQGSYTLEPHDLVASTKPVLVFRNSGMVVYAVRVIHGGFPALAWRVEMGGKRLVFSGDTNGRRGWTYAARDGRGFVRRS